MKTLAELTIFALATYGLGKLIWKPYWYILNNYPKNKPKEIVICAAVKFENIIIRGHRHADCIHTAHRMNIDTSHKGSDEGFITSQNRFVNRKEGYRIQIAANIKSILEKTHKEDAYLHNELYSEDLY